MHPPTVIYLMLIGPAIVAFTVYVILEIEYPRLGWVRIDDIDAVLAGARASMK